MKKVTGNVKVTFTTSGGEQFLCRGNVRSPTSTVLHSAGYAKWPSSS